jgi:hypothetical protein
MRSKCLAAMLVLCLGGAIAAHAATLRVVVVEASDADGYVKAIEQGKALLKSKGSSGTIRVWRARFAGDKAGQIAVAIEFPNLEAVAKDDALMASDAELRAWLQSLDKFRKIVSDSIYTELGQ